MKYLITGSEGFIGSHLMDLFPGSIGIDNRSMNKVLRDDTITRDIVTDNFDEFIKESDIVIHCACSDIRTSMHDQFLDAEVNIIGTLNLLSSCRKYKKPFMYISSVSVHTESSHYAISKRSGERYTIMYRQWIPTCIIRLSNVYGDRDTESVIGKWTTEPVIKLINPDASRDFVYIKDAIRGIKLSLEKWPQDIIDIGTGESIDLGNLASMISSIRKVPIETIPAREIDNVIYRHVDWIPAYNKLKFTANYSIKNGLADMGFHE